MITLAKEKGSTLKTLHEPRIFSYVYIEYIVYIHFLFYALKILKGEDKLGNTEQQSPMGTIYLWLWGYRFCSL